jgi:ubiquinone biosynthesis protein UbiJ
VIDRLAASAVADLLNRLLARETWARDRLMPFADRVARFETPLAAVALRIAADGNVIAADAATPAQVSIGVDLAALPNALVDPQALLRDVRLSGDAEFAQALGFVLQNLRPEPEEELSRFVGDVLAHRLIALLRTALTEGRAAGQRLATTAADYFVTESPLLVARGDAEQFGRDVVALRDRVERLAKRLALLEPRQG